MSARVLCVDDEPRVLEGFDLHLGMEHDLLTAQSGAEGLELIESEGPFDVVVSDMQMPGMDGATFLSAVRTRAPDTERILLTGHADLTAALRAINEGAIFRFLTKPCASEVLLRTVEEAAELRRLKQSERELLERTVRGCVEMLGEVLGVAAPVAHARAQRTRTLAKRLIVGTEVAADQHWEVDVAALLCRLGTIAVPSEVLDKAASGEALDEREQQLLRKVPETGATLLEKVPRLEGAAGLLRRVDPGAALEPWAEARAEPALAILRVAGWVDNALARGMDWADAVRHVERASGPKLAELLGCEPRAKRDAAQVVRVAELRAGMALTSDVRTTDGQCVVRAGAELTHPLVLRLRAFAENVGLVEPIHVCGAA